MNKWAGFPPRCSIHRTGFRVETARVIKCPNPIIWWQIITHVMYMTEASLICLESGLALLRKALSPINTPMTFDLWDKSMGLISGCRLDWHLQGPDTMVVTAALCVSVCVRDSHNPLLHVTTLLCVFVYSFIHLLFSCRLLFNIIIAFILH